MKNHVLVVRALRNLGFGEVCESDPHDYANAGRRLSGGLSMATLVGLVPSLMVLGEIGLLEAAGLVAGTVAVLLVLSMGDVLLTPKRIFVILLSAWLAAAGMLMARGQGKEIMLTHLLPVGIVYGLIWGRRALVLAVRVPIFIPAGLVLVLAPLLTEDPWRFSAEAKGQLGLLAAVVVLPLLILVLVRLRRLNLAGVFARAADAVAAEMDRSAQRGVLTLWSRCLTKERWPDGDGLLRYLRRSFAKHILPRSAEILASTIPAQFHRKGMTRLLMLLVGVGVVNFTLIYGIAVAAMPESLAGEWSKATITHLGPALLWPYAGTAALFTIVAAVGFLAFALTEETYTTALVDIVYGDLAQEVVIIGAAYLNNSGVPAPEPIPVVEAPPPKAAPTPKPHPVFRRKKRKRPVGKK